MLCFMTRHSMKSVAPAVAKGESSNQSLRPKCQQVKQPSSWWYRHVPRIESTNECRRCSSEEFRHDRENCVFGCNFELQKNASKPVGSPRGDGRCNFASTRLPLLCASRSGSFRLRIGCLFIVCNLFPVVVSQHSLHVQLIFEPDVRC